jgi:formate hydrogenlyase transcriptional activator
MGKNIDPVTPQALQALMRYHWPGNIRELQNIIERAVVLSEDRTLAIDESQLRKGSPPPAFVSGPFAKTIADREREMIEAALAESRGRISGPSGAAAKLGIPRQTLDSKISNLQISKSRFKARFSMDAAS